MTHKTRLRNAALLSALLIGLSGCGLLGIGGRDNNDRGDQITTADETRPTYAPIDLPPGAVALSSSVSVQLSADTAADDLPITLSDGNVVYRLGPTYLSALGQTCRPFRSKLDVGGIMAQSAVCSDGKGWYAVRPVVLSVE